MRFRNQRLERETLILTDQHTNSLGPNLTLVNCTVRVGCVASQLVISGLYMEGGVFEAKDELVNFQFDRASFVGVKFAGRYSGCDFGLVDGERRATVGISKADFSEAVLDNCRIMNTRVDEFRFASWPTVIVLEPRANVPTINLEAFPPRWKTFLGALARSPSYCNAAIINVGLLVERYGGSESELKTAVEAYPFVIHL